LGSCGRERPQDYDSRGRLSHYVCRLLDRLGGGMQK